MRLGVTALSLLLATQALANQQTPYLRGLQAAADDNPTADYKPLEMTPKKPAVAKPAAPADDAEAPAVVEEKPKKKVEGAPQAITAAPKADAPAGGADAAAAAPKADDAGADAAPKKVVAGGDIPTNWYEVDHSKGQTPENVKGDGKSFTMTVGPEQNAVKIHSTDVRSPMVMVMARSIRMDLQLG